LEDTLQARAYHEAGHLVVAYLLGRPFERASIIADPDGALVGYCHHAALPAAFATEGLRPDPDPEANEQLIQSCVTTALAGGIAEEMGTGAASTWGTDADRHAAVNLAVYEVGEEQLEAYLAEARNRAAVLLKQHWSAVEALASALVEQRELDGNRARALLAGTMQSAPPELPSDMGST
jgi:ATP-dependent Zn protease